MVRALVALSNFYIASTFGGGGNGVDGEGLRGRFFILYLLILLFCAGRVSSPEFVYNLFQFCNNNAVVVGVVLEALNVKLVNEQIANGRALIVANF